MTKSADMHAARIAKRHHEEETLGHVADLNAPLAKIDLQLLPEGVSNTPLPVPQPRAPAARGNSPRDGPQAHPVAILLGRIPPDHVGVPRVEQPRVTAIRFTGLSLITRPRSGGDGQSPKACARGLRSSEIDQCAGNQQHPNADRRHNDNGKCVPSISL